MVVLTPNDQLRNTAYRVGEHNLITICQEFRRAYKVVKQLRESSKIIIKDDKESKAAKLNEELKELPAEDGTITSEEDDMNFSMEEIIRQR